MQVRKSTFKIMTSIFLLSSTICVICNLAVNKSLNWSLIAIGGMLIAWMTLSPLLLLQNHKCITSVILCCISTLLLLYLLEFLSPVKGMILRVGRPITIFSSISLLIVVYLFIYTKISRWYILCIVLLLTVINDLMINLTIDVNPIYSIIKTVVKTFLIGLVVYLIVKRVNEKKQ